MPLIYSVYEAKARFSEVIRQVREGRTVAVSSRVRTIDWSGNGVVVETNAGVRATYPCEIKRS